MVDKYNLLLSSINKLPRVKLANLPTPLEHAPRFSELFDGPNIYFKRDDLTGLPLTGNKTRMFEFSLAKAIKENAEIILAGAGVQSNYCRQLAFACNKLGLEVYLVLLNIRGKKDHEIQGNLFLDLLAGAKVKIIKGDLLNLSDYLEEAKIEIFNKTGKKVHVMRSTTYDTALEGIGYTYCGLELYNQLNNLKLKSDYIYMCSSDTTQAGLIVANKFLDAGWNIVGISPIGKEFNTKLRILNIATKISELLDLKIKIEEDDVINLTDYIGDGYGLMSQSGIESIEILAKTEGIIFDPVYSSKGLSGLIDHIKKDKFKNSNSIVYLHTGGFPSIFAYADEFKFNNLIIAEGN